MTGFVSAIGAQSCLTPSSLLCTAEAIDAVLTILSSQLESRIVGIWELRNQENFLKKARLYQISRKAYIDFNRREVWLPVRSIKVRAHQLFESLRSVVCIELNSKYYNGFNNVFSTPALLRNSQRKVMPYQP